MRIPLTIAGLPELESLNSGERADLLASCNAPSPLRLWTSSLIRGMCVAAVVFFFLHIGSGARQLAGPVGAAILLGGTLCLTWVMHALRMIRIRGQIRLAIEAASRGGLVPICMACGHDCSRTTATKCPECGAPRRVSRLARKDSR